MKSTRPTETRRGPAENRAPGSEPAPSPRTGSQPTSVVFRSARDPRRQHAAIGKLMKMCQASPVVSQASRGITAEVRKDRDRGHD